MPTLDSRSDPARVVIAGGGVAALETLIALRGTMPGSLEVIVISAAGDFHYRPLQVGEPFGLGQAQRHSVGTLCSDLRADFVHDRLVSVDTAAHTVSTAAGQLIGYDILVLAIGANAFPAFEHGVTFDRETVPEDFDEVLSATGGGLAEQVAIVVPEGTTWTLPAYELALLTAGYSPQASVTLITHEHAPLIAFGSTASRGVTEILDAAGVAVRVGERADVATPTALRVGWEWFEASRIVALPMLKGPGLPGLPHDAHGFVPVDDYGRVEGEADVYAAGDGTTIPIKQGGLAAQQADVVASDIAARLGAPVERAPLRPVLRGLLVTRDGPRYLRVELDDLEGTSAISDQPLWWPPSKIASRWLAPYLERAEGDRGHGIVTPAGAGLADGPSGRAEREARDKAAARLSRLN